MCGRAHQDTNPIHLRSGQFVSELQDALHCEYPASLCCVMISLYFWRQNLHSKEICPLRLVMECQWILSIDIQAIFGPRAVCCARMTARTTNYFLKKKKKKLEP